MDVYTVLDRKPSQLPTPNVGVGYPPRENLADQLSYRPMDR